MTAQHIPVKKIESWSFSKYSTYKLCPAKAKFQYIDKIKEPANPAMERGSLIHDQCEKYIKGGLKRLPMACEAFESEFKALREQYNKVSSGMVVEDSWAFTKEWDETQWNNWVSCWVRIKLDCAHHEDDTTLVITDWKTGKYRAASNADYREQLELYALAALLLHDHIEVVKPRLVYLDAEVVYPEPNSEEEEGFMFTRDDIPSLKNIWELRTKPMLNDTQFAPRPNFLCGWCFFRSDNVSAGGGQCEY